MTSRIEKTFARLRAEKRAALIPFVMGYDPDAKTSAAVLDALPEAGADIVEIGMPFSDPVADGPVIQAAGLRALKAGATVSGILELVREFRKKHANTPVILMGYFNPVYRYGCERFCQDAVAAGADGIILVDLPPEEEQEMRPHLEATGLKLIRLVAPTSGDDRLPLLAKSASGFIYYISITGITGAQAADALELKTKVDHLRKFTALPVAVGFGIKTPRQAAQAASCADAVVVGSALVDAVAHQKDRAHAVKAASAFVRELAEALG
ncbi:MAG: tryptophan synthase subunit alpha [Pseudomonadota bacterium]|nr:tryptophan synthase subunit alpha [Pseudomonadota bacterium]MDE3037299.1 tryptophan synthase subunit alpha [Pseudomonadota bacterium]